MVIVVSGCSRRESMMESGTTADIASIASSNNDWPSDVPLYPQSIKRSSREQNLPDKSTIVLFSGDTIDAIKKYYNAELPHQGWTITSSMIVENNSVYRAEKENRVLFMTVTGGDGSVNIALGVSKKA